MSEENANIPKAVLYVGTKHAWSIAAQVCLIEKGYGADEVDIRHVDLGKGENYAPTFLRLNSQGTVPTLIVPFENTLSPAPGTEARFKAVTDIESIVLTLDRARNAASRTHTTSTAPAPALSPATIEGNALARTIISLLHSAPASPELLFLMNARDTTTLSTYSSTLRPFLAGRAAALTEFAQAQENAGIKVSSKTRAFWEEKKVAAEKLIAAVDAEGKEREEYFENSKAAWEVGLGAVLNKLSAEIAGPFTLGDQFSTADVHLSAWLSYVVYLAGGGPSDSGAVAVDKLEKHIGGGFLLPRISGAAGTAGVSGGDEATPKADEGQPKSTTKLGVYWDAAKERASWKAVEEALAK
ncbi:hypothetical protein PENSPDRAFT_657433 [Peniophora sp. CONT]|nr:hypothetical protein PENSPDRAFT_657433 [Peniophora sp. CONT]